MAKAPKKTTTKKATTKKSATQKTATKQATKSAKKPASPKTAVPKTTRSDAPPVRETGEFTHQQIAAKAFEIYDDRVRHGKPGTPNGDWLEALRRLRAGR